MTWDDWYIELFTHLGSVAEFLGWEASVCLDPTVPQDVRYDLDRLSLIAEEVERGIRDKSEFYTLVASILEQGRALHDYTD